MRVFSWLLLVLCSGACGSVKDESAPPQAMTYTEGRHEVAFKNDAIDGYLACLPAGYSPESTYPMIVAFHGAVGDAETAYRRWADSSAGSILICPNGTARMGWQIGIDPLDEILGCLDDAQDRFSVDKDRIWLTGHSMGGHVSWNLATFHAERFPAVAPTASAPMYQDNLDNLLSLPLYVVHGRNDGVVSLAKNQQAEEYINTHGGSMTLVVIDDAGHGFITAQQDDIINFFREHPSSI